MRSRSRWLFALAIAIGASASAGPSRSTFAKDAEPGGWITAGAPARATRSLARGADVGAWHATWDRDTGVVAELWGTHVDAPGATADAPRAEAAARALIAQHLAALAPGAAIGDFAVVSNTLSRGVRTVGFAQRWRGLRVVDAQIGVVIERDRVFALISTAVPSVAIADAITAPRAAGQRTRAAAWIGGDAIAAAPSERVILPIVHGAGAIDYRLADVADVSRASPRGRWDVYVAPDGTPIARRSTLHGDTGEITLNAGVRYAWGERYDTPAITQFITANGSAAMTDGSGFVTWDDSGGDPAAIVTSALGSAVVIVNTAGSGATAAFSLADGGSASWNAGSDEFADAQVSTYVYASIALARARIINPSIDDFLAGPHEFDVNEPGDCNGYSDGTIVYLYQAGGGCENTGRVADLTEHEFGHVFHNHSVLQGIGSFSMDQGQAEGIADWNAANINDDPGVGRGLYFTNVPVRDIDPPGYERVYPTDLAADPHISGEILSGALWDLRKTFIAESGSDVGQARAEAIFLGVMQRSPDMPGAYMAALVADDDDGDLGDGTPDECDLEAAFGAHGLVTGYVATAALTPILDGAQITVPVTAGVSPSGCPTRTVASMTVNWQLAGTGSGSAALASFALAAAGSAWTGAFPDEPDGAVIHYQVVVQFDDGTAATLPANLADPLYETFVGSAHPLMCAAMDTDPMWANTGGVGMEWQWGMPFTSNSESGDPIAAHTGSNLLGTVVTSLFQDGYYYANDHTTVTTPVVDASDYAAVHLQYWRWLTVEDGQYDQAQILANGSAVWTNAATAAGTLDHVDREWRFQDVDVTPNVQDGGVAITWALISDPSDELGGWNIDDVCVVGLSKLPLCGDGVLDQDEQCDDGSANGAAGDPCTTDCQLVVHAGGGCAASDAAGGGAGAAAIAALALARVRRRRRVR